MGVKYTSFLASCSFLSVLNVIELFSLIFTLCIEYLLYAVNSSKTNDLDTYQCFNNLSGDRFLRVDLSFGTKESKAEAGT